jgi:hypothetical protein
MFESDGIIAYFKKIWFSVFNQGVFNSYGSPAPFLLTPSGATMDVAISGGQAYNSEGQLIDAAGGGSVTLTANVWGHLIARFKYTGDELIPKPSDPLTMVYKNLIDDYDLVFVPGTPGAYPVKDALDVLICGVKVPAGATHADQATFDYSISEIAYQAVDTFDNRLRPFKQSAKVLGIQPSQTYGTGVPKRFTFLGINRPSIYPKNAGNLFNPGPSYANMETGVVSGADEMTGGFIPTIPGAGLSVVAVVSVKPDDTLSVGYGVPGTLQQCLDAVQNQIAGAAPGNLPDILPYFLSSMVVVSSADGATVSDIQVFDMRSYGQTATVSLLKQEYLTAVPGHPEQWALSQLPANDESLFMVVDGPVENDKWTRAGLIVTLAEVPDAAQKPYAVYMVNSAGFTANGLVGPVPVQEVVSGDVDGVNVTFVLAFPCSPNANLIFTLDGVIKFRGVGLDYTVAPDRKTITCAAPPERGQKPYAIYGK